MGLTPLVLSLFVPAMAHAAVFSWAIPEPTLSVSAMDGWSPAPTSPPQLPFGLSRREQSGSNTCGFASGASGSRLLQQTAVTCPISTETCATNTYFGAHGCCDPASKSACTLATACIASTAMSASCTDKACSTNAAIAKCTDSSAPACYEWRFIYDRMVFTQHGCAATPFTSTAFHSLGMDLSSSNANKETLAATVGQEPLITPTLSDTAFSSSSTKPGIGVIVGGTIGACFFVSFIALVVFLVWRRHRAARRNGMQPQRRTIVEYNPLGFPSSVFSSPANPYEDDYKRWQQRQPAQRGVEIPQYLGMGQGRLGIVEVDGIEQPVEAPTAEK
ncbi:hypothetical protein GMOD_00003607 [Pyrenophora seminiperda CCB06]|uniref:Uncharacterized protein n=1 Tax=Pyrenophora seminiperda CCB06 TaxID=1302712 RepID=A0A3M7MJ47_9PLEO|nr:hypothetical protein GMOD_00003607 [Pyrenophora seminiperda CCB06]